MSSDPSENETTTQQCVQLENFIRDFIRNENHISPQVKRYIVNNFDVLLCVLSRNVHFIRLFQSWTCLSVHQRRLLDQQALAQIDTNYQLYVSLKCCLAVWEHIQDVMGAPGYDTQDNKDVLHHKGYADVLSKVESMIGCWTKKSRRC